MNLKLQINIEKQKNTSGFTLIEMLIAITVFVIFLTILMNSYNQILRSQKESDEYRVLYSQSRRVFDEITNEVLVGRISYPDVSGGIVAEYNGVMNEISLIGNADEKISIEYVEDTDGLGDIYLKKDLVESFSEQKINSDLKVKDFNVFISPAANPYKSENVYMDSLQFQPKVTVFARFVLDPKVYKSDQEFVLQTTLSSRFYMP